MKDIDIQELRHFLNFDTTGGRPTIDPLPWRMWGGELRSTLPEYGPDDADYDHSRIVATFYSRPNEHGGSHVANLYFVQAAVSALGPLLDDIEAKDAAMATVQQQVRDLRAALGRFIQSRDIQWDPETPDSTVLGFLEYEESLARAALAATAEPEAER